MPPKAKQTDAAGHPSASTAARFPRDLLLRRHGFAIAARPRGKPAVWVRHGKAYTEREALDAIGAAETTA